VALSTLAASMTQPVENGMTNGEQRLMMRGVAAGTLIGLALGGMIALVIAMKPAFFAALIG